MIDGQLSRQGETLGGFFVVEIKGLILNP